MANATGSTPTYDKPATFVNVKRVRQETDSKGRDQTVLTFGLTTDKNGNEVNTADALIAALLPYQGKQVNLDIRIEEKTSQQGRKFPSAFVRVVEMIPKDQGGGTTTAQYVPKPTRAQSVAATAEKLKKQFVEE